MTKATVISYAPMIGMHEDAKGWKARFTFQADCGREHTHSSEQLWQGDHYYVETRSILCADVEDGCPNGEMITEVELVHPSRNWNDSRQGQKQRFIPIPNFGGGIGL